MPEAAQRTPPPAESPTWPVISLAQAHAALTAPGSPFEVETITIDGRPVKWWKNAPPTLLHTFMAAKAHGQKTFIVYEDERISFDAFMRASLAFAAELRAAGVKPGDRVALAMRNLPEWPVAFFAGVLNGAVVAALNAWWSGPELAFGIRDSGSTVAIFDAERMERMRPLMGELPDLKRIYVSRGGDEGGGAESDPRVTSLEGVIGRAGAWKDLPEGEAPTHVPAPEDGAVLFFTSGTSGNPKGALGTHRNAGCSLMAAQFSLVRSMIRRGEAVPQPDPDAPQRVGLVSIPFFHTTGCNAVLLPAVALGQKLVCQRRFEPGEACALIEREGVQTIGGVPAVAIAILSCPERAKHDLSTLEVVAYGGAPAPETLVRKIAADMHAAPGSGWGMTETSATHTHHLAEDYLNRPLSCGPAMPVSEVKVVDEAGNALPSGEVGELMAYGPNIVKGYWNRPEETAATFIDGWVKTGDIARIDEEGFVFIVDRKKDVIIRGGENIYCQEVEDVLYAHPAVVEAALVARAHPVLGEEAVAFVSLLPGRSATADELRGFVAERLAGFKVPAEVRIATSLLPRNAAGKIVKPELKAALAREAGQ